MSDARFVVAGGLIATLAFACSGATLRPRDGGAAGEDGAVDHVANDGDGDAGVAGQGGQSGGAAGGGAAGCVPSSDPVMTNCNNGVVTIHSECPDRTTQSGTCPYGCKYGGEFGAVGLGICNSEPVDAGADGAAGAGPGGTCVPGPDNVSTSCVAGVATLHSFCPPSTSMVGTCPYGCRYPDVFGNVGLSYVCNGEPPDGGCDGTCGDARADVAGE